jgi:2'-5' RNA ligase
MPRLFVAVWPPDDVVAQLAALPRPELPGVRWTTPDQWHVTLRFLGEADPDDAADRLARAELASATAELGPRVSRLGSGVVTIPVAGLDRLAAAVDAAFDEPPDHRFRGHLTLARVRRGRSPPGLLGEPFQARFPVDDVTLVVSTLSPHGARYDVIGRWVARGAWD